MTYNISYEYTDETSIDPELICTICNAPFTDPLCTSCDHTFCNKCISEWMNTGNVECPICRQQLISRNNLAQATRTVRNMLDRLSIKCLICGKTGLQRGDFDEHKNKACSGVHVSCSSADIKCPWKGPQEQLNNHVTTCIFQLLRPIFSELIAENRQLKERITQMETQINQQNIQINHLKVPSPTNTVRPRMNDGISTDRKRPCEDCRNKCHFDAHHGYTRPNVGGGCIYYSSCKCPCH